MSNFTFPSLLRQVDMASDVPASFWEEEVYQEGNLVVLLGDFGSRLIAGFASSGRRPAICRRFRLVFMWRDLVICHRLFRLY